jgi:methyl-accepting chemotaxis protein
MGPKNQFKRRKYLVDHGFQVKFFLSRWFQAIAACAFISTAGILAIYCSSVYGVRVSPYLMAAPIVILLVLIFRWGNRVSHKVAGPMFRISKDSKEMLSGNLEQRIKLRGGDQLGPLADTLNQMLKSVEETIAKDRVQVEQSKKDIHKIEEMLTLDSLDAEQTQSIRTQLKQIRNNLESITSDFKLRDDDNDAAARE